MGNFDPIINSFTKILLFLLLLLLPPGSHSAPISLEFIRSNFNASYFNLIDNSGVFLTSPGRGAFTAAITNTNPDYHNQLVQTTTDYSFYLAVIHSDSGAIVWSANRNSPVSNSAVFRLTSTGLSFADDSGNLVWSTPPFPSPSSVATLLQLQDSGNLLLLDQFNRSLWESFDHPTDTIVLGQKLPVGESMVSARTNVNLSTGDYRFAVTGGGDALMTWNGMTYWKLSMVAEAYKVSNVPASYMAINGTGLYLFGANGSLVVVHVNLGESGFRLAKLEPTGKFSVKSYKNRKWAQEFTGPQDECKIPNVCGRIGLCSTGTCSCPPGFLHNSETNGGCLPTDGSYSLPSACNASVNANGSENNNSFTSYMKLGEGMDYFSNGFTDPLVHGVNLSVCEDLCSKNCSCLGLFHDYSSGSCYLLENHLGSIMSQSITNGIGYIKALFVANAAGPSGGRRKPHLPLVGLVLLPSFASFLLVTLLVVGNLWFRKRKSRNGVVKLGHTNSSSSTELEIISIPGLPVRFGYKELVFATENFKTQIGFGAFGTVYKGTMPDKTVVAVKKITSLGVEGKKEFCTEIAIIGNIHHVNLVRLKGFCAQGRQRFLVYEYMNKGSLDRALFGKGPVLEWQERFEIALGTARGLAYLHSACEQKIIHCDVKPENILLHNNVQVKISDFGLSKLLSPEQSGWFTTMRGTRGYLAPEWLSNSAITDKSDVYSYGMVLLEIIRGRRNCSSSLIGNGLSPSPSSTYFPLFALEMHEQRRYLELADPRLEGRVTSEEVGKLVRVALCCVHEEPMLRPSMANVAGMLEGGHPLGVPRVESLNFLRFFGQRFTEASRIEGYSEDNALVLLPQVNGPYNSNSSGSHNSYTYISSQQVSGPR